MEGAFQVRFGPTPANLEKLKEAVASLRKMIGALLPKENAESAVCAVCFASRCVQYGALRCNAAFAAMKARPATKSDTVVMRQAAADDAAIIL